MPRGAAMPECRKIRPTGLYAGKQGFTYNEGVSAESSGAQAICMHLLTIPPGGRARAHKHTTHETAIYMIAGETTMFWGDRLQHRMDTEAGDLIYIPADMPHLPVNLGSQPATAVIARTDPNEQESVTLLPDLEALVSV
jgi:uncharacterized RmlC-like cupin family protein